MATTSADVHRGTWLDPDAGKITLRAFASGWLAQQTFEASTREAIETRRGGTSCPCWAATRWLS
jgi:hypothetical protein